MWRVGAERVPATYARQNHESGGAKTFVAVEPNAPTRVLGFYTVAPGALDFADVPDLAKRGLARYDVPVFRLGRLAVATSEQGRRLGGALLMAAGQRALTVAEAVGGVALAIDAKDDAAARWTSALGRCIFSTTHWRSSFRSQRSLRR